MTNINNLLKQKAAEGARPDMSLPKQRMDVIINTVKEIPLELIKPDPDQPRKSFDDAALESLAASIDEKGLIHPILIKPDGKFYLIIAGHRRYYAYKKLGRKTIPAIVFERTLSAKDLTEFALIENLQREDLNTLEIAESIYKLKSLKDASQNEISKVTGYSQPNISKYIQIHSAVLQNPLIAEKVKEMGFKKAYEKYCSSPRTKKNKKFATANNGKVFTIALDDKNDPESIKEAISKAENVLRELEQLLKALNYSR